jgi:DNA (cytosine-5)-methyltransferase 1
VDTTSPITHVSLCAGYGGIDLGLKRAVPALRTIAFSEIEAFACANLVAKMEAGLLDAAPIWTNLKSFPWQSFRGRVDILSGGYPCQPFSAAGKRLGTDDPRHLWPYIADGIRAMQPRICFFENVEGHISLGLREVIRELESIGYRATWGIFSAREVGAPHQRKRVFIMADNKGQRIQGHRADWLQEPRSYVGQALPVRGGEGCELADTSDDTDTASGHAETDRLPSEYRQAVCSGESGGADADAWPSRPGQPQHEWEPPRVVANSNSIKSSEGRGDNGEMLEVSAREQTDECATLSGRESDLRGEVVGNANPAIRHGAEQSQRPSGNLPCGSGEGMGHAKNADGQNRKQSWPGGQNRFAGNNQQVFRPIEPGRTDSNPAECGQCQAQPPLGGNTDGSAGGLDYAELCISGDNRTDELRLLGNGVVPATAELAFRILSERLN